VVCADARSLRSELGPVSAVITSPPYVGTYDYAEQHRLRLAFLGFDVRDMVRGEIAARRSFKADPRRATRQVERDFGQVLLQAGRIAPGGPIVLVIGDSIAAGQAVFADDLVRAAAGERFEVIAWAWQERPKLGPERTAFGARAKREHVIALRGR
jgi:hypothetical protein